MKKLYSLILAGTLLGCVAQREVQFDLIDATVVKIDTIGRYPDVQHKALTWRTKDNFDFVTYVPIQSDLCLGRTMKVLMKR